MSPRGYTYGVGSARRGAAERGSEKIHARQECPSGHDRTVREITRWTQLVSDRENGVIVLAR
jgi:hypothetical protein